MSQHPALPYLRNSEKGKIVTAVGRELLGFIWAIGVKVETAGKQPMAA